MNNYPIFSRQFFEKQFPRFQKFMDCAGGARSVLLTVDEGYRIELREYQLCPSGLLIQSPSGDLLIPFHSIQSIQVVSKKKLQDSTSARKP